MARPRNIRKLFADVRKKDTRLSTWMRQNYVILIEQIRPDRVEWKPFLLIIAQLDLRDEHGQPVTPDTAARTWRRIRKEMDEKAKRAAAAAGPDLRPGEIAAGVRPVFQSRLGTSGPVLPVASALPSATTSPGPDASAAQSGAPAAQPLLGATEQVQAALSKLGLGRVPMPKSSR
ncbi:hypothetical protein ABEV34_19335 [Methylorubrum rhodesianum]|jgi:hypothetical protein|uniref:hypothetical protein n=1 Tax=Methylorubrum rhodesianum TaxID=29427 RepID=UPI002882CDB8|nr:hypothetical protein [Microbacterium sp. ARD31]MDT0188532.1 hypothetical protein [Microbacterium sp. ARD31]MDV2988411.1 hypothetical protein [Methylobacteriaceae bacterium AG10]